MRADVGELMRDIARSALVPVMWAWVLAQSLEVRAFPIPADSPHAYASGIDPIRVLLFGSGPAVGRGVVSHSLALPGALARTLSARTRRGVEVDLVSESWLTSGAAARRFAALELSQYDAVVVFVGVDDALSLVSLSRWRRNVSAMLSAAFRTAAASARVYFVGVQPIRSLPVFDSALGTVADRHAIAMNGRTEEECARWPRATFIRFRDADRAPSMRFRDAPAYTRIAQLLADSMQSQLPDRNSAVIRSGPS
ncbi:MAG TPA: hypothetical protein DCP11_10795 [Microbacteriaceae bacterium]|nr:hypothetical protein [Microbacteriaceae bacterium]